LLSLGSAYATHTQITRMHGTTVRGSRLVRGTIDIQSTLAITDLAIPDPLLYRTDQRLQDFTPALQKFAKSDSAKTEFLLRSFPPFYANTIENIKSTYDGTVLIVYLSRYLCSFLSLFVYKDIHHAYSHMLLFLSLFIKCPTVSYMRLYYHVVQPYSMYLYTGISHVVRNIKHRFYTHLARIPLARLLQVLRWSPLSRTYLRIDYVGIQAVYTPPYPICNNMKEKRQLNLVHFLIALLQ